MHRVILFFAVIVLLSGNVFAGNATIMWNPVEDIDLDLAGYKIYYGTSSRGAATRPNGYANVITIPRTTLSNPATPSYTITNLPDNVAHYFAVTSYDDKTPANESAYSLEVSKLIVPTNTVTNVGFTPRLQGGTSITGNVFTIKLYSAGGTSLVGELSVSPDTAGKITVPAGITLTSGLYDILVKTPRYLQKRLSNTTLNSNAVITLPILLMGDLDNNNNINALDWTSVVRDWGTNNANSDLNGDGLVNSIDISLMHNNWGPGET